MRASRLLSVLLTLQTRGQVTAQELADELEVSVRTVYRDIESLSAAGIPVYAERGPAGGYRLLDGFRTKINGLTADEADSLMLTGLPGPAAELGLGAVVASAQLKLMAGLAPELRERAARAGERFHLDTVGWYHAAENSPHLADAANAVWHGRRIRITYRRWGGKVSPRVVEPYGLVLKAGVWYLVARAVEAAPAAGPGESGQSGEPRRAERTYRIGRILELEALDESFERDPAFALADYWAAWSEEFETNLYTVPAMVRLSPRARAAVGTLFGALRERVVAETASAPDDAGWVRAVLPLESVQFGALDLLRLGPEAEVLGPPELRRIIEEYARSVVAMYASSPGAEPAPAVESAGPGGPAADA
ncbi:helix-turn-helix transcriptional regulator [Yinghuangia soli]|uniref:YafY family transcriptional regulator n=1 Tax=Yinghuangia soli TaxID=2908204 RepID=A0AA41Q7W2_9ACTN|nr:YafY family protein [Yinghuangia soli]MCF2532371.1 YafY family transcriptional regulator [Yinghuangia soli]